MNPIASAKRRRRRAKPPMTCDDLARDGRWDQSLCCPDCHRDPDHWLIWDAVTKRDPLNGCQQAMLCCHAFHALADWYPGKVITVFPEHEE
jgi:hypothetical protein